ncbi:hypothetical protein [Fuscovulum ytuae]|uniref:Terminase small subunit n=1 Tax=Fuscovulum ytuae TaxID=3042299 RepID=A0ABY8Q4W2_9RHOB|nr:hypothetical protein [Fuscovulum sp. YMD61]WGV15913.1 hypothetical protein QF092_16925 [Fuscovulum sp. YMD61]
MARRYRASSTAFQRGRNPSEKNPADPLRREKHETFAKAFALIPNARAAAIEAGYPRPRAIRAAGRLLSVKAMWARIQYLQTRDAEVLTTQRLVQELHLKPKAALAKAIAQNPFTGETRVDLGRLTPSEVACLDFSTHSSDGVTRSGAGLKVNSSQGKALASVGRIITNPTYAPERRGKNSFADALVEIARRNESAAPIRTKMAGVDDDDF